MEVLAHRDDAAVIRGEKVAPKPVLTPAEQGLFDQVAGAMPELPPCQVDIELVDGDTVDIGGGAHIIATPGHTDGSIAIWAPRERVLLTGDIIANSPSGLLLGPFNVDRERSRESAFALTRTAGAAAVVAFGHGDPLFDAAGEATWQAFTHTCQPGPQAVPDPLG